MTRAHGVQERFSVKATGLPLLAEVPSLLELRFTHPSGAMSKEHGQRNQLVLSYLNLP